MEPDYPTKIHALNGWQESPDWAAACPPAMVVSKVPNDRTNCYFVHYSSVWRSDNAKHCSCSFWVITEAIEGSSLSFDASTGRRRVSDEGMRLRLRYSERM
ncbi:unnamed protein product [Calypogeia fissa]